MVLRVVPHLVDLCVLQRVLPGQPDLVGDEAGDGKGLGDLVASPLQQGQLAVREGGLQLAKLLLGQADVFVLDVAVGLLRSVTKRDSISKSFQLNSFVFRLYQQEPGQLRAAAAVEVGELHVRRGHPSFCAKRRVQRSAECENAGGKLAAWASRVQVNDASSPSHRCGRYPRRRHPAAAAVVAEGGGWAVVRGPLLRNFPCDCCYVKSKCFRRKTKYPRTALHIFLLFFICQ